MGNCDECDNWIQTSSHCKAGVPFTLWLVFSDNVAVFRCAWRSRRWYSDGNARRRCTVFRGEEFDACYQDWNQRSSTGCGKPIDPNCKALYNQEVVRMETCEWETTCLDTERECTPCWFQMDRRRASRTEDTWREIHFTGCFRSVEGSSMAVGMLLFGIGEHRGSQWYFRTMVQWMATRQLGGFFNFPMTERDFLPIFVKERAEYPESEEDEASN